MCSAAIKPETSLPFLSLSLSLSLSLLKMWQILLAASIAASTSLIAKQFLNHKPKEEQSTGFGSAFASTDAYECGKEQDSDFEQQRDGIFRFSSSGASSGSKKTRILRKKSGITGRRLKFGGENYKADKRSGGFEGNNTKRFSVCLKKRRTAKTVPVKCVSRSSKDGSLFGWGLSVGIMYMMSAGKAEISKLSTTMDETSKVVQELKTELYKRKSSQMDSGSKKLIKNDQPLLYKDTKVSGISVTDDVECPSSVLTDEPEPPLLEMDQLEAELATELQKLPWSDTNTFGHERIEANMAEKNEVLRDELEGLNTNQYNGVLPSELDKKLCHLLIEQQENQIEELESELHSAQSKLNEKEAELQTLKDCVRRLTEFSLSTVSDDEAEIQTEQDRHNKMGSESESKKSVVGMKRPITST
ncbi:uncharacterized protein [Euphorbia lathyris]|uniref:uncharacterized protein n=1 Tax=Euphorbia lathyris TaxID=212925 RepID=UPI003313B3E2